MLSCDLLRVCVGYQKMKKETSDYHKVFFEEIEVCNNGTARYLLDLARTEKYQVTRDFAAAVCNLPVTYQQSYYVSFIENWGTVSMLITSMFYLLVRTNILEIIRTFLS